MQHINKIMTQIKTIIFDLGGVIINLDIPKTIAEFNRFSPIPFESVYTQLQQYPVFDDFDKGLISEEAFFNELHKVINHTGAPELIIAAWNAMLLDFPKHRLDLLISLKSRYRLFLLSNTNETHIRAFEADLLKHHGHPNLESFFEKVYYSCRMGMRKPDTEIFEKVLSDNNLLASETIFIDDSPQHVEGALKAGINAHLLAKGRDVNELIEDLQLL